VEENKVTKEVLIDQILGDIPNAISEAKFHVLREGHATNFKLLKNKEVREKFADYFLAEFNIRKKVYISGLKGKFIKHKTPEKTIEDLAANLKTLLNTYILDNLDDVDKLYDEDNSLVNYKNFLVLARTLITEKI